MAVLITRTSKGSPLLATEVDQNFQNLNTELATKVSLASPVFTTPMVIPSTINLVSTSNNLPNAHPSLNLDFVTSNRLDPRITFTRASNATRFNKNGVIETVAANRPRFDYDPVTRECKGLLVEEARDRKSVV